MAVIQGLENAFGAFSGVQLVGAVAALIVFYNLYHYVDYKIRENRFARLHGCKPVAKKFPVKDPILGMDVASRRIKFAKQHKLLEMGYNDFKEYGNTYSIKVGAQRVIMTIEPENVKTVLSLKFKDFGIGNREKTLGRLLGRGIFTTDGEAWSHSRAMIRPNFARDQVADLDAFERHIQTLFKILPRDGSTVDLQEYFFKFTIDSATEFLFGTSSGTLKSSAAGDASTNMEVSFATAFNKAQHAVATRGRIGMLRHFYSDKAGDEAIRICHEFVDQFVDEAVQYREALEKGEKRAEKYVFLHELATQTTNKRALRDELLNVLLAGRDTTASLLSNMWIYIASRPDIYAKLRAEVEPLAGRPPTYSELRNMKYLKYCMNESLRIHPVVPANSRIAFVDTYLPRGGGPDGQSPLFVPKGALVSYWTYAMHRRPDYYGADAEEFRPERWEALRPGWEYLPFNGGPRICLGQQYALTEAGYVTVRLLQEFKAVESRDGEPWSESLTLTLCSKNGTLVGLTPA